MSGSSEQDSVPTLLPGDSLARLARILHCAQVLGRDAPAGASVLREDGSAPPPAAPGASPSVEESVKRLFELLDQRHVDYVLVGGLALLRYVRGRNTEDIDLLLAVRDLATLPELAVSERSDWFARAAFSGLRMDLRFTENPFFRLVRERHTGCIPFLERGVPCATPEGLVLLKLYALPSLYRQGQIQRANLHEGDIAALIHGPGVEALPLLRTLEEFMPATGRAGTAARGGGNPRPAPGLRLIPVCSQDETNPSPRPSPHRMGRGWPEDGCGESSDGIRSGLAPVDRSVEWATSKQGHFPPSPGEPHAFGVSHTPRQRHRHREVRPHLARGMSI